MLHRRPDYQEIESKNAAYVGVEPEAIAQQIIDGLKTRHETLAIAESLTGGILMGFITAKDGSSKILRGGMVTYATELKHKLLGVDSELILEHGVVDGEVALQMALGVRLRTSINDVPTAWGLSTTGVASGWSDDKEHGTVFIGISSDKHSEYYGPFKFDGDREQVRRATAKEALVRFLNRIEMPQSEETRMEKIVLVQVVG
jgi:nicotinamide-nucleotide amidase